MSQAHNCKIDKSVFYKINVYVFSMSFNALRSYSLFTEIRKISLLGVKWKYINTEIISKKTHLEFEQRLIKIVIRCLY